MCATRVIHKKNIELLKDSLLNKDTAFDRKERETFDLDGLLPPHIESIDEQLIRAYSSFKQKESTLQKHIYLRALQDRNETLFYALIRAHITEMMPIIYTPTVGEACQKFSQIYRQPRGLFIPYPMKDRISELLDNFPDDRNIKVIVVTDGERILGLGDQGVDGMGIPIGKLALYTACGGICPEETLPITLDVGTNNVERREHPEYIGWRQGRITGKEYDDFVDAFVKAVHKKFPNVLLQFEDFAQTHASPLLMRYREKLCTFNDDIQGTAAVCVSALLAATKVLKSKLSEHRICVVGGGSAGCGISDMLIQAMEIEGISEKEAIERFYVVDRYGLLDDSMTLLNFQKRFSRSKEALTSYRRNADGHIDLLSVIETAKPTILLGVSGQPSIFTKEIIEKMASYCKRPIIFPMSNPTSRCEATPEHLLHWTQGQALVATGSPFHPVKLDDKTVTIAQSNNAYIFPGLGLGIVATEATYVSDGMLMAASIALSELSPAIKDSEASLLPSLENITEVSKIIALAVGKKAIEEGYASALDEKELKEKIEKTFWQPQYATYQLSE